MQRIAAQSEQATQALELVSQLQQRFVEQLEALCQEQGTPQPFEVVEWCRDEGRHGGGMRYGTADGAVIGRGSVNVSQVHYDDMPDKRLASANAISTIIHPKHPHVPSVHIHISWTEMRDGQGYWRMMADLNPAIANEQDKHVFLQALQEAAPEHFAEATAQGDRYFLIPVLQRHRGIAHFYLEQYHTQDTQADFLLAKKVGETAIDTYVRIVRNALSQASDISAHEQDEQLAYHSLYFFQVLTLDRGTTTGLLVHNQNDLGIMGSLPAFVNRELLQSWVAKMPAPQEQLLQGLIDVLPASNPALVDDAVKIALAQVVRQHYQHHPEAIAMQASGDVVPPTVHNHASIKA